MRSAIRSTRPRCVSGSKASAWASRRPSSAAPIISPVSWQARSRNGPLRSRRPASTWIEAGLFDQPELARRRGNPLLLRWGILENVERRAECLLGGIRPAQHLARTHQPDPALDIARRLAEAAGQPIHHSLNHRRPLCRLHGLGGADIRSGGAALVGDSKTRGRDIGGGLLLTLQHGEQAAVWLGRHAIEPL